MEETVIVKVGCVDFLVQEVESLRQQNKIQAAQLQVMDGFFNMIDRLGAPKSQGYSEDKLWQAKREIQTAKELNRKS